MLIRILKECRAYGYYGYLKLEKDEVLDIDNVEEVTVLNWNKERYSFGPSSQVKFMETYSQSSFYIDKAEFLESVVVIENHKFNEKQEP